MPDRRQCDQKQPALPNGAKALRGEEAGDSDAHAHARLRRVAPRAQVDRVECLDVTVRPKKNGK